MMTYKPIRKSAYMKYISCPKMFSYFYNDPDYFNYNEPDDKTTSTYFGTLFHNGCYDFFDKFIEIMKNKDHNYDFTQSYSFRDLLPRNTEIDSWFDWFADIETQRYKDILKLKRVGCFVPISREIEVKMQDKIDRTGHIDRIDIEPLTNELTIIEYKTGKHYDLDKTSVKKNMNLEIGFYVSIINKTNMFKDYTITKYKVINPTLQKIWIQDVDLKMIDNADRVYDEIVDKIVNKQNFERNISNLCDYCPYVDDCLFIDKQLITFSDE